MSLSKDYFLFHKIENLFRDSPFRFGETNETACEIGFAPPFAWPKMQSALSS